MPLTQHDMKDMECDVPGCTSCNNIMVLTSSCHDKGHAVKYDKRSGTLTVECHVCGKFVADFLLAERLSS